MIVAIQEREDSVLRYPIENAESLRDVVVLKTANERRVTVGLGVTSPIARITTIARQVKSIEDEKGKEVR